MYIYMRLGTSDLYIDEAHTALDIFRFAAFLWCVNSNKRILMNISLFCCVLFLLLLTFKYTSIKISENLDFDRAKHPGENSM